MKRNLQRKRPSGARNASLDSRLCPTIPARRLHVEPQTQSHLAEGRDLSVSPPDARERLPSPPLRHHRRNAPEPKAKGHGCELLDQALLEKVLHTPVYYTYAYASCEKGSIENANGLLRYHFSKGTDFSKVRTTAIAAAERAINNTLRRTSLHGTTAAEAYQAQRHALENSRPA